MKKTLCLSLAMTLLLAACAPKVQSPSLGGGTQNFGPRFSDVNLREGLRESDATKLDISWQGEVATSNFFRQAQNVYNLGLLTNNPTLRQKGLTWIKKFYSQPKTTSYQALALAPYAGLAIAQTKTEVTSSLETIQSDLSRAKVQLRERLMTIGKQFPWATRQVRVEILIKEVENFTETFLAQIPSLGLSAPVEEGLISEISAQTRPYFSKMAAFTKSFYESTNFYKNLGLIQQLLKEFEVTLPDEYSKQLNQGLQIGHGIEVISDAQGALTVLVDVWRTLTPEEREKYYGSANETLYDFLRKQNEKDLDCLRTPGCRGGLIDGITKKVFILPKIEKFGVLKIRDTLNDTALKFLIGVVENFALGFVHEIPGIFADNIDNGITKKAADIRDVQNNYEPYVKDLLHKWSVRKMNSYDGKVAGFETPSIQLQLTKKSPLQIQGVGSPASLRANTAGSSVMARSLLMENTDDASLGLQTALSQINKLITIGGYRDINDRLVPALLSPVEKVKHPLDIMKLSEMPYSYRIPDQVTLQDPFHVNPGMDYAKDFSAASFAEQIDGLSQMLKITADWKVSSFDKYLGNIKAQELIEDIQSSEFARPLFPKDMFFALNVGDVAVLLKDITKKATPVFLVTLDDNIIWADQYSTSNETAIMGGIVDMKDGVKSNIVRSVDVAKFLLSLNEFLVATDGVEKTKSSILLEKDSNGRSNLDDLIEGRRDLKLLIVSLANFISNQLINEDSLVQSQYKLKEFKRSAEVPYRAYEQAYAIRALLAAWKLTKIDAYLWSAQEIYYAMNKQLFSTKEQFYVNGDGTTLDFPQKVVTLLALMELAPHLPVESNVQLSKITSPWLQALSGLQN
ncbi:hypothetical protein [Bdellovibrio sp. KM01]|uniref:hypothetical protein n=1 Tax=Bdellovibrio sp. KM01 TaxID=2748865 RepID=UPI0015EAB23A|nr:hypothetical protein [Bdellovibrio sp. KM01]QLY26731.1 hypothetical protein HW988_06900 [Bdellovibrio sp. KM01]